ncbi:hypothetical protein K461DRAFT_267472 [Myriangium duriaei CBS 260.36]|uniref:Uncharacterized protein n=1 Tax=Myriangium duriaei CBS 260.36 TaxID=1168546 RepID=A0A9P4J457_9PEZI|nr:hypothetical protein K461DRAFT_267472 [Myriangium duriaei CBS 260.36]
MTPYVFAVKAAVKESKDLCMFYNARPRVSSLIATVNQLVSQGPEKLELYYNLECENSLGSTTKKANLELENDLKVKNKLEFNDSLDELEKGSSSSSSLKTTSNHHPSSTSKAGASNTVSIFSRPATSSTTTHGQTTIPSTAHPTTTSTITTLATFSTTSPTTTTTTTITTTSTPPIFVLFFQSLDSSNHYRGLVADLHKSI